MNSKEEKQTTLFPELNAEDTVTDVIEIESLCLACERNGLTKLLLTKIPYYKEIIISSFSCTHCGNSNNQTQFGGKFQNSGIRFKLCVRNLKDLSRQVVRSDFATVRIPELDFEIPPVQRTGEVTNIEGILGRTISNLTAEQPIRKVIDLESYNKLNTFIESLQLCKSLNKEFHFILDDPSGNSFIENPFAPAKDDQMEVSNYKRSNDEDNLLGITQVNEELEKLTVEDEKEKEENLSDEVLMFPSNCFQCNSPCDTNMKVTKIPHFKEVVLMATTCDVCGHRTNEVKSGSGIEDKGVKITLHVTEPSDLSRDILKSETCRVEIPELDFEMSGGTLGGKFTTLEGLLQTVKTQLTEDHPFVFGDSAEEDTTKKMRDFAKTLEDIISCKKLVHIILDDPAGNSYVQNLYAPDPDPEMEIEYYERSFEQNEDLGLNDMKVENYECNN